ncbi:MAG TPA: AAA family ATPase [Paludibacteraceae bacterium]|nr:AAA family ATPase [Paludibacteraceae bacterium]HOU69610.1 AAA family ATPase [Paludibacteraceae bacterium]HQF51256.1 AAA family ATPase [Paludibacteraceae bacterium]
MISQIDTDNPEFQNALNLIAHTNQSVFLTGKAGTGKSTFLKYICEKVNKRHIVLAPTGVAAINAGGVTIHSFFKMPFRPMMPDDPDLSLKNNRIFEFLKYTKAKIKIIEKAELIIIDEISMVRADMIDFIDKVLRVYSHNMRLPFGGKQLLFVGDLYQLEPVVPSDQKQILSRFYPNAYFFSANVFRETQLVTIELQKVYRQNDEHFIRMLDHIRVNSVTAADLSALNHECRLNKFTGDEDFVVTLATKRDTVDYINESKLSALPGESFRYNGVIQGDFPESALPTQRILELKENAQVLFVKNDKEKRWYNGTIGIISHIDEENRIYVLLEDGKENLVEMDSWENIRYYYDEAENKIKEEVLGTFTQYPIRLAWSITVHKSQGLTFDRVIVDLTGGVFAAGQTYVALSRCKSLEGLMLKRQISQADVFVSREVVDFSKKYNDKQMIDKALKEAKADILYGEAVRKFNERDFDGMIDDFFQAIHSRYDIEKPLAKRFIRRKLGVINQLEEKVKTLREEKEAQRKKFAEMSHEYYLMGNECIVKLKNAKAALANFDKAIFLNPKNVDALVRRGVTLFDEGDFMEAEKSLTAAVKLSPTLFKTVYNRGKNRLGLQNYEGALTDLSKAVSLKPDHKMAHELLGDAYSKMGDMSMAMKHWNIAHADNEEEEE